MSDHPTGLRASATASDDSGRPGAPRPRLVRAPRPPAAAPELDERQQQVVDHPSGPLLVLAGPGTGKTTTLVEAVVDRTTRRGLDPEQALVLTFSRKAAAELRERITARIGRTTKEPLARTFHSYAYGLLRAEAVLRGEPPPRLLSGPEQDVVVRDLLEGDLDELRDGGPGRGSEVGPESARWPAALHPALDTRGFAQELRDLLQRAVERGIDPSGLAAFARRTGRADWAAAARFAVQYEQVTALAEVEALDPAALIRSVVDLWQRDPQALLRERSRRLAVFVDEYQDTDPAQEQLLALLAGDGRDLVVVGDPDQSIYGFRGTDVRCIREFPDRFRTPAGAAAPVVGLVTCRRSGAVLLEAAGRVARRLPGPVAHRARVPAPGLPPGGVEAHVLRSQGAEAGYVAARLREAHLRDGVPWSQMAVLVRSTAESGPSLRRALMAAGVPVSSAGEEIPLVEQPAVRPLLGLLEVCVRPTALDDERAAALLVSPYVGADALALRRVIAAVRVAGLRGSAAAAAEPAEGVDAVADRGGAAPGLAALLRKALAVPAPGSGLPGDAVRALAALPAAERAPVRRLAELLAAGAAAVWRPGTTKWLEDEEDDRKPGATAEEVLWSLWSVAGVASRWQRQSAAGGSRGAAADRDLDAVVALFDAVARFVDRLPGSGPAVFLDHVAAQQIPGDTMAASAPVRDSVRLLTAHAAKGLEWRVVVVAGVTEGTWPNLRVRGSFLGSEQLVDVIGGEPQLAPDAAAVGRLGAQLAEERRLFYVAVTRARERLLVTAVRNEREGEQPSRFVDELVPLPPRDGTARAGAEDEVRPLTRVPRGLSLTGLVGELRSVVTDPGAPEDRRRRAARHLARLAAEGVRGADPDDWWGLPQQSVDGSVVDEGEPVAVSPSKVEAFAACPLQWFLTSSGGDRPAGAGQGLGTLLHELAAHPAFPDESVLLPLLDERLAAIDFGAPWVAERERERARAGLRRLVAWAHDRPTELLGREVSFSVDVGRARIGGQVDRLERDAQGRAVVVDLKTGKTPPSATAARRNAQLGTYQLAAEHGAFTAQGASGSGGAALVQIGQRGSGRAKEQAQPPVSADDEPRWAADLVERAAQGMAAAAFPAVQNDGCDRCPVRTSCPVQSEGRQVGSS